MRAVVLASGQFSLVLVRCNYASVQARMMQHLHSQSELNIHALVLSPSVTTLQATIQRSLMGQQPDALAILGLESVTAIDELLTSTNQMRDEFRKNFPFPVLLWVNDAVLLKLIRFAPDFKSWAATAIKFAIAAEQLMAFLQERTNTVFAQALQSGSSQFPQQNAFEWVLAAPNAMELEFARWDLHSQRWAIEPVVEAGVEFILGQHDYVRDRLDSALNRFHQSLKLLHHTAGQQEKEAILSIYIGLCHCRCVDLNPAQKQVHWSEAKHFLQMGIECLEHVQRQDLVAEWIVQLGTVLEHLKDWDALQALSQSALEVHETLEMPLQLARNYGFLAEVALERGSWTDADYLAQQALQMLDRVPATTTQDSGLFLFLLAQAQYHLGHSEAAIGNLQQALQESEPGCNPQLYLRILATLRSRYFERGNYHEAFQLKQEQRSLEQQYGFRAFVGARQLQPQLQAMHPALDRQRNRTARSFVSPELSTQPSIAIAQEIVATGQMQDVQRLIERIGRSDCKLTVIHGKSGVGKSSLLNAGLFPALQQKAIGDRHAIPVILRVYSDWEGVLGNQLAALLVNWLVEPERSAFLANPPASAPEILAQLHKNAAGNLLTVLIFDQLEEFFFACSDGSKRKQFYDFLNNCLNVPFVKIILSLREDYLHYLLECERLTQPGAVNNNILDKEIRYYLGNFTPNRAKTAIQSLTERAGFYLETELIEALVGDLAGELGMVSPIELQVVGAQLQTDEVATLAQYRQLGTNPKEKLVQRSLAVVIQDCGKENEAIAWCVLGALTDEKGTRPLKTKYELANELELPANQLDMVLEILVGSGLAFLLREEPEHCYQLVHDYLVAPIRRKHVSGMKLLLSRAEAAKKRSQAQLSRVRQWALRVAIAFTAIALGLAVIAESQRRRATISEARAQISALSASSEALFVSHKEFDALLEGLRAWKYLNQAKQGVAANRMRVVTTLQQAMYGVRERNRLEGHRDVVWDVSFSPDGQLLASASNDRTIKLWRPDGMLVRTLSGHDHRLTSVSFSPDGQSLVSSSSDQTARLWSHDGRLLAILQGHSEGVQSASFSPDGKTILTASLDGTAKLWNRQGKLLLTLAGDSDALSWARFSPDGQLIATAGDDATVKLWNLQGKLLRTLRKHQGRVMALAFSPRGHLLATAGADKTIRLWPLESRAEPTALEGHDAAIWNLSFSPDGRTLASASEDKTVKLWNLEGKLLETFKGHGDWVTSVSFSPNQPVLASASFDKTVKLWSLEESSPIVLRGHRDRVTSVSFSPDGQHLASASRDNTVKLWNRNGTLLKTLEGHRDRVTSVSFSPDGQTLASGGWDTLIKLWNQDGKVLHTLYAHRDNVTSTSFSPDGRLLASASKDKTIKLWNRNGTLLKTLNGHRDRVNGISFSPDGQTLASASDDGTVKLWSRKGTLLKTLNGHSNWVLDVRFSPDGQLLASASWDNTVKLWSRDGTLLKTLLKGYADSVTSVSFSPDTSAANPQNPFFQFQRHHLLAAASWDGTVKLWSQDGTLLKVLQGHDSGVLGVSFSPDGNLLASAGADNTAILWNLDLDNLLARSCRWLKDYFHTNPNAQEDGHLCKGIDIGKAEDRVGKADGRR